MCVEVRKLVLKRHIITIAVYIVSYFYVFMDFFYIAFQLDSANLIENAKKDQWRGYNEWYIKVFKIIFAVQGVLNVILRT